MPACKEYRKCINQLFRSKVVWPKWMRPKGMGDCTTCQPCEMNKECIGYYPAPGLFTVEIKEEKT